MIEAEVGAVWRSEVGPAIVENREAMTNHGPVREILRSLRRNVSDFFKGVGLPAGVTVFPANMLDLSTAVTTGLAGEVVADDGRQVEIRRRHVDTAPEGGSRDPTWAAPTARPTRSRVAATVEWVTAAQRREPSGTLSLRTTAQGHGLRFRAAYLF
jgi:hypothetical protein